MREFKVTEDILLKEIEMEVAEAIFQTIEHEREFLQEWLPFVELTQDLSFTRHFIENYLNSDKLDLTCTIYFKHQFVGIIGLKDTDIDNKKTEIGYWLSEHFQGKGIITQSCKALNDFAFSKMKMNRIQIKAATENIKSWKIPERLGFTFEGIERNGELHDRGFVDLKIYSLLRNEFQSTHY